MSARAVLVDRIERRALEQLHRTVEGQAALLETHLADCEWRGAWHGELVRLAPGWLAGRLAERALDQARHGKRLRARLAELRALRAPAVRSAPVAPDPSLDEARDRRRRALADRFASSFGLGRVVPLLAIRVAADRAQVSALASHLEVLQRLALRARAGHPTLELLATLLEDRRRHLRDGERALDRLTTPAEKLALARVAGEAGAIDRWPSATGAVGLLALGIALRGVDAVRGAVKAVERRL